MILSTRLDKARFTDRAACLSILVAGLITSTAVFAQSDTDETKTADEDLYITVESGDTFSDIVTREMRSYDAWGEIARYNKLESPDNLQPGDVIVIPAAVLKLRNYATVTFTKGKATHHSTIKGTKGTLAKGDKIYPGDMIETDSDGFVNVSFNGGSSVNIQPDSTMKIDELECINREDACQIELRSEKGELGLDVQNEDFQKPTVFSIDSPYASAAVRGTRFDFDIDDGNALGVTEGTVEIAINGNRNEVEAGKGVLVAESGSIGDLIDLLSNPAFKLNDDFTRISEEDLINWDEVSSAAGYLLAFDENESMQSALTTVTETNLYTKPELPAGDFYISGRAFDANGLRGFTSKKLLRSVAIDEQVESPELEIVLDGTEMKITAAGSPADDIEVKIGNELLMLGSTEYILSQDTRQLKGGDTMTVEADPGMSWYLQSRKIVNEGTVSPYGLLYVFEKVGG